MNLIELVTALSMFGLITIFVTKVYNVMRFGKFYDIAKGIIAFTSGLVLFFLIFIGCVTMPSVATAAYLKFTSLLVALIGILTIAEVIIFLASQSVRPLMPLKARR